MPFNGSGSFTRVHDWTTDRDNNINITASRMDSEMDGMATGLTQCITKTGESTPTSNLPMGSFIHTGVGNASERTHYAAAGQVQDSSFTWCGTAGGTANALTLSPTPAITAYATGQSFTFKAGASPNSAATTVAISGLSTIAVQFNGAACIGGEILASKWYRITLDTTSTAQLEAISTQLPFIDSTPIIRGSSDNTKQVRFEADGLTTATTRVVTVPDANGTMAYVETGAWTPAFTSTSATFAYNHQVGSYVKVGNLVLLEFRIALNGAPGGTTSNTTFISGAPFTCSTLSNLIFGGHVGHYLNINIASGNGIAWQGQSGGTTFELKEVGDTLGETSLLASTFGAAGEIRGTIMYICA